MARGTTKKIAVAINKPGQKGATASASALQEQREEARQTLLKAKGTRSQYASHLERGRWFLADVVEQKRTAQAEGTHSQADGESDIDAYSRMFDIIPNRYSASALELFLVQKELTEGRSLSTMWGIFSTFKDMWKNTYIFKGETYCGPYHCDEGTGVVTGNPALSVAAQDMMEVLKNNEGAEGGSRNHVSAMTIKDMQKLMAWSYSQCPDGIVSHATLPSSPQGLRLTGLMHALIYHRNFELIKIKQKDIVWNCQGRPPYGIPFDLVSLINHKGWQRKGEIDGALEGHEYEVYAQPKTPEICMFTHLRAWVSFLEEVLLQRPLQPEEYIFLCIGANGVVYPSDELSYNTVMKTLTWICAKAGLTARYTSHCFCRGGARYQFMFAPLGECWSLSTICWWVGLLICNLTRYEKNHRDALCPIPREGNKSFNSDHILTAPITTAETRELKMSFDRELNRLSGKVKEVLDKLTLSPASFPYPSLLPSPSQPPISVQQTMRHQATNPPSLLSSTETSSIPSPVPVDSASSPFPRIIPILQVPPSDSRQYSCGAAKKTAPIPGIGIPDLLHGQEAWLAAVKQWEDPAASIGSKALKDWPEEWYTGPMHTITGVKRNIHKVIAIEFYWLQRDHQVFLEAYPEATRSVKPLFDTIQCQREGCREITSQASKNGHPEVQASSSC
ncbi:uncharacterized protein F5147DRAFT_578467 [Suillus discolor]|uniref:Uncharacterized protein n=1 Tax=Suillus discolor TaxID=1912936 RepID=A0A9P7JSR5_9AGAM|nr:uncharacterized protein F5147DRAFT_578467 [Suillus discolor]KAG2106775.1 hypothetical protein F5147DRAFT_578467 [Suillus discolor]